jgi:hypothetical protein
MAAMSTALTEFSTSGDSRTYSLTSHTASKARLVVQKRRVPSGNQKVAETIISVVYACDDDNGDLLQSKVVYTATVRYPIDIGASETDITDALAVFRDIVAGDEFTNTVNTQEFLA